MSDADSLTGQRALVTGGTKGIGAHPAEGLRTTTFPLPQRTRKDGRP